MAVSRLAIVVGLLMVPEPIQTRNPFITSLYASVYTSDWLRFAKCSERCTLRSHFYSLRTAQNRVRLVRSVRRPRFACTAANDCAGCQARNWICLAPFAFCLLLMCKLRDDCAEFHRRKWVRSAHFARWSPRTCTRPGDVDENLPRKWFRSADQHTPHIFGDNAEGAGNVFAGKHANAT